MNHSTTPPTFVSRSERAVFRQLTGGDGVLLHLDTAGYFGLDRVGCLLWNSITDGGTPVRELLAALRQEFTDAPASMEADVHAFLRNLQERQLVTLSVQAA